MKLTVVLILGSGADLVQPPAVLRKSMSRIIYSNKIFDPKSKAVHPHEDYLVCKKVDNKWRLIEGAHSINQAEYARDVMAKHDLINGHITDLSAYAVFHRKYCDIQETM